MPPVLKELEEAGAYFVSSHGGAKLSERRFASCWIGLDEPTPEVYKLRQCRGCPCGCPDQEDMCRQNNHEPNS